MPHLSRSPLGPRRLVLSVGLASALLSLPCAAAPICDGSTTLTLLGMDTTSGRMLFAFPGAPPQAGWLVELAGNAETAHAYPASGAFFGGSVGPGAILALSACGAECVQLMRWQDGGWQPAGEPLTLPQTSTAAVTYDRSGAPWIVALTATEDEAARRAWAFRREGSVWRPRGQLVVHAVGQPQALPAPMRVDGVVTGTGLFGAASPPEIWAGGIPKLPPNRRGQLIALAAGGAAYLSSDGVLYLSGDAGKTWRRSVWTPGGEGETVGMWRQGSDFAVDLPFSDRLGELEVVWFDRRKPSDERIVLSRLAAGGQWSQVGEAANVVQSKSGEQLPVTQVLVPHAGAFVLLSGCAATAGGSGLVLRAAAGGAISAPRLVPIVVENRIEKSGTSSALSPQQPGHPADPPARDAP
jgi:hypothetical protein